MVGVCDGPPEPADCSNFVMRLRSSKCPAYGINEIHAFVTNGWRAHALGKIQPKFTKVNKAVASQKFCVVRSAFHPLN